MDVRIGEPEWNNDRPWVGQIDEVRIFGRALSAGEVAGLAGQTGTITQPLAGVLSGTADTDIYDDEAIDFKDVGVLVDTWLDELLWP